MHRSTLCPFEVKRINICQQVWIIFFHFTGEIILMIFARVLQQHCISRVSRWTICKVRKHSTIELFKIMKTVLLFKHLYKKYIHQVILCRGDFTTCNLKSSKVYTLHLESNTTKQFKNVHNFSKIEKNEYGEGFNTFPRLNTAVSNLSNLFNMTMSYNYQHRLNDNILRNTFNNLSKDTFSHSYHYNWAIFRCDFSRFDTIFITIFKKCELLRFCQDVKKTKILSDWAMSFFS